MKSVKFRCGHCSKGMEAGAGLCGTRVECPHCRQPVEVPLLNSRVATVEPAAETSGGEQFAIAENVLFFVGTIGAILAGMLGAFTMVEGNVVPGAAIVVAAVTVAFWAFVGIVLIRISRDVSRIANRESND